MNAYRPQARRTARVPLWPLQLALLIASAVVAVAVIWFALSLLTSMGSYIETVIP